MDTELIDTLRAAHGKVGVAARRLKTSRQHIYDRMKANPEIGAALEEIRLASQRERVENESLRARALAAIRDISLDELTVIAIAHAQRGGRQEAIRRLLMSRAAAKLSIETETLERLVAEHEQIRNAIERRVALESSPARVTVNTSLTDAQLRWIRKQPEGTAARLLADVVASGRWPTVSDTTEQKTQTTFSVNKSDAEALRKVAVERCETSQTLLRQVIEVARRAGGRG